MNNKIAFIFPGQGSQSVGMGKDLYNNFDIAKNFYDQADDFFDFSLSSISFNGPENNLKETKYTQPAIFVNSCIISNILQSEGIKASAVCGHSLGELSALYSAKSISFIDGLKIVKERSEAMHLAGKNNPGRMAAFIGLNETRIKELFLQNDIVVIANINSADQLVISGSIEGINNTIKKAQDEGIKKIFPLNVSGAFHSPLMNEAKDHLKNILSKIKFHDTTIPVYQNINAKPEFSGKQLKTNFLNQIVSPVKWLNTIEKLIFNDINTFLELGPGNVLQRLNRRINKNSVNFGVSNFKEINKIINEF
tara:strand:- start:194 stop:1117 length:924 start_codon:yes stop_codon:yes gene_type:complete